ncbi:MAG: hypothetical protein K6F77_10580 [Lachnospiraceae bacterium]|nr:hypothetical protein [Lachnospiraceae bacterium]
MIKFNNAYDGVDTLAGLLFSEEDENRLNFKEYKIMMLAVTRSSEDWIQLENVELKIDEIKEYIGENENMARNDFLSENPIMHKVLYNSNVMVEMDGEKKRVPVIKRMTLNHDSIDFTVNLELLAFINDLSFGFVPRWQDDINVMTRPETVLLYNHFARMLETMPERKEKYTIEDLIRITGVKKEDYIYYVCDALYVDYHKFETEVLDPVCEELIKCGNVRFYEFGYKIYEKEEVFNTSDGCLGYVYGFRIFNYDEYEEHSETELMFC